MSTYPIGPITSNLVNTDPEPQSAVVYDTGQLADSLIGFSLVYSGSETGYQGSAGHVTVSWYDGTDTLLSVATGAQINWGTGPAITFTGTAPAASTRAVVTFGAALDPSGTYASPTASCTINGSLTGSGTAYYCAYGTRLKPGLPQLLLLTPEILTTVVAAVTEGWAWPVASLFFGSAINVSALCGTPRPAEVHMTLDDVADILSLPPTPRSGPALLKAGQWIRWAAWPVVCECNPAPGGSPPPVPYPPIVQPPPVGAPPAPVIVCDDTDLCSQIVLIQRALNGLIESQRVTLSLVTLMQRQSVPFAYVLGTRHSGLSGAGTFAVQGILGLSVEVTTIPPRLSATMAPVNSWFRFGELSLGTAEGWERRLLVTHNPHLFLEVQADISVVAYQFEAGVVANIVELVREP